MRVPSWIKHSLILAAFYWVFSFAGVFATVFFFRAPINELIYNTGRDLALSLGNDSDAVLAEKFARIRAYRAKGPTLIGNVWFVDGEGNTLSSTILQPLPPYWKEGPLPTELFKPSIYGNFGAPKQHVVILIRKDPVRYLVFDELKGLPAAVNPPTVGAIIGKGAYYFQILYILFVACLSTITVLYVFRNKAAQATVVMESIEGGDFKQRFSISRMDELGGLMAKFNRMAQTIESLVERLKRSDYSRKTLIQELNHDLRTPLTSMRLMVDNLSDHHVKFTAKKRAGLLKELSKELDYTTRLVQFLFALPSMEEANYRVDFAEEDISKLVREEVEHRGARALGGKKALKWTVKATVRGACLVEGDRSLLSRLVRNSLDNAAKFAAGRVHAELSETRTDWVLEVFDDGPGPSEVAIRNFGKRPAQPAKLEIFKPEASAGLGSAIMSAVAELHGGRITLNRGQAPWGAVLRLTLPKASLKVPRRAA